MATTMIVTESEALELFEEMLNDCNEPYRMGYLEFSPAEILRKLDPVAYREEFLCYIDAMESDGAFIVEE